MKIRIATCCLLAFCASSTVFAAETKKPQGIPFETTTCGNLLDVFAAADPKLNKDTKMLKGAQDRAFAFVAWTHGYLNGRDGIDAKRYPFNQTGVTQLVGEIYKACKGNDPKLFLEIVKEIH